MAAKVKHQVSFVEATMNPRAECQDCTWRMAHSKLTTVAACKAHVAETGHRVTRIRETIANYYPID
jgi:hypothetical protein